MAPSTSRLVAGSREPLSGAPASAAVQRSRAHAPTAQLPPSCRRQSAATKLILQVCALFSNLHASLHTVFWALKLATSSEPGSGIAQISDEQQPAVMTDDVTIGAHGVRSLSLGIVRENGWEFMCLQTWKKFMEP